MIHRSGSQRETFLSKQMMVVEEAMQQILNNNLIRWDQRYSI